MDNNITYEQYCLVIEQYKKQMSELPFNKESAQDRKRLHDDYVDFMLKYTDYYTRYTEQHCEQADEDISYVVNDVIEKLNDRLQSGDYSAEQCYDWMMMEKNCLQYEYPGLVHDCQFLYPERINLDNIIKNLKEINNE